MAREIGTPTWQKSRKRWVLRIQRDGQRKWFYSTTPGKKGQRECEDKAAAWLAMDPNEPEVDPVISDVYEEWVQETLDTTSTNQARIYESLGRLYILPAIGNLRVGRLRNEQQVQNIINSAFKDSVSGRQLSKKYLSTLKATIVTFLRYCRKRGLTTLHPENLVVPRMATAVGRKILQPDELRALFASDQTRPRNGRDRREWFIHAYRFQVITGMRPGEVLGLRPGDVRNGLICVRRSWTSRGEWTSGKNDNAPRDIPLTGYARDEIAHQALLLRDAGMQDCPLLFPGENGEPAREATYRRHLAVYCEHNSITVVSPYELRHTFISMNQSLPIDVVKRIAGHSESMDTLGVYGHEVDGDAERTARLLDEVMRGILQT